ncbi:MobC family plasmid mobilization relaxosome protein [Heyndrickxia sporothermodurans]|uniref:MobC family plasmid mobilization relaxosome protein n=1 Tax=Heyndrickxia sporothermodurans TaxID=46224 RepID=UPI002DBC1F2E|nr:MobC family plasmid mobilization relaxosome protein [Heyndrickxia sporothermodurans]MEB6551475.1 MobC family plasmid mobilization relaxosome protein [Heyndrickxia sporothermodurans]
MGENRKENRQIKFRVSDPEFEKLEQMAKASGMSVPTFCKKKAQGARMSSPKIDREGAFEIARQLRAIGNNVNQLSKRANEGKAIPSEELQDVQKELHALWQQFNLAIQK